MTELRAVFPDVLLLQEFLYSGRGLPDVRQRVGVERATRHEAANRSAQWPPDGVGPR